eukprot:gene25425-biopygen10506
MPDVEHPAQEGRRPADVFLPTWDRRCPAAFDFAITSPHRLDVVRLAADQGGISFLPMVFEPSGACGPTARDVFRKLVRVGNAPAEEDPKTFAHRIRQRFCVLVRRQAAQAVLRRGRVRSEDPDDAPVQCALAVSAAARLEETDLAQLLAARRPPPTAVPHSPQARSHVPPIVVTRVPTAQAATLRPSETPTHFTLPAKDAHTTTSITQ